MIAIRGLRRASLLAALVSAGACAVAGHTSSPWEWGGAVRLAPGLWNLNDGDATIHPVASWTYLSFDGGNDQLLELGGQLRFPMGAASARPFWVGGEATFSHLRTSFDVPGGTSTGSSNGYSITGLVGAPVGDNRWGPTSTPGSGSATTAPRAGTSDSGSTSSRPSCGATDRVAPRAPGPRRHATPRMCHRGSAARR